MANSHGAIRPCMAGWGCMITGKRSVASGASTILQCPFITGGSGRVGTRMAWHAGAIYDLNMPDDAIFL